MDIEQLRLYCLDKKGVTEGFPFGEDVLVFKVMNKMFALIGLNRYPLGVNLKCAPEKAEILRETWDGLILPGYHMSKTHWNTVQFGEIPEPLVRELVDHSYELIIESLPKKVRQQWEAL